MKSRLSNQQMYRTGTCSGSAATRWKTYFQIYRLYINFLVGTKNFGGPGRFSKVVAGKATTIRIARFYARSNAVAHCRRWSYGAIFSSTAQNQGKIVWREVKVVLLGLGKHQTSGKQNYYKGCIDVDCGVLGDINYSQLAYISSV